MYRSHTQDLKIWGCKGVYPRLVRMDEFFTQSGCGFMRRYLHDHIFFYFFIFFRGGGIIGINPVSRRPKPPIFLAEAVKIKPPEALADNGCGIEAPQHGKNRLCLLSQTIKS